MTVIENLMVVPGNQKGENLILLFNTNSKKLKKKMKRLKKKL